ncbi:unnamed protein product [Brugia timori]|uniref:Uncharacterized protein n=1 Tax=Brugia timori TaxID=42155 RepID=A0A0R3QGF8_9BILA|nr:unnamed protein product [Brugia timori]
MTETKKDLKFSKDGNTVYYKSYKQYFYEPNMSCPSCRDNPELILPNVAALVLLLSHFLILFFVTFKNNLGFPLFVAFRNNLEILL